jgi:hypothetical protein
MKTITTLLITFLTIQSLNAQGRIAMKINKITLIPLFVLFALISYKKDPSLNKAELIGTWVEQFENSFQHKLIFETGTLYLFKSSSTDTLSYRVDEKQERIYLSLKNDPSSTESNHKILLNRKGILMIWGLFANTPNNESETIFQRE